MSHNPMDSYQDIHPWEHHWDTNYAPEVAQQIAPLTFLMPYMEVWTYGKHWDHASPNPWNDPTFITDLYWGDGDFDRYQMPKWAGDFIADWLISQRAAKILVLIWWGRCWRWDRGWADWDGTQGDFVTHLHVEWDKRVLTGVIDERPGGLPT